MTPETLAPVSVEEYWRIAHRLERSELVAGQVVELTPPGSRHGATVMALVRVIDEHVRRHDVGIVFIETGFILRRDPPTVRGPDLSVVLKARIPDPLPRGFFSGPPDLAVEVLSFDDRPSEIAAKVADYLAAGTRAVWVVDPEAATITVHTREGALKYRAHETLRDDPVLLGLETPVQSLLS